MGWFPFDWFTPKAERRIKFARMLIEVGDYNEARLELEGLDHPDAAPLRAQALDALVQLNLLEWVAQRGQGDGRDAQEALSRAKQFGATKEQIDAASSAKLTPGYTAAHRLPKPPTS